MGLSSWLRSIPAVAITRNMIDKAILEHKQRMAEIEKANEKAGIAKGNSKEK